MLTVKEISERTGLNMAMTRKYINKFKPFLNSHIIRGNNNQILFNDEGVGIFDRIKHLKDKGLTVPLIMEDLKKSISQVENVSINLGDDLSKPHTNSELYERLIDARAKFESEKDSHHKEINELHKKISELEKSNLILRNELNLLPEGKDAKTLKKEYEIKQKKEFEQKNQELKEAKEEQERIKKRNKILSELKNTTLNIFKRKKLIDELEKLI